MSLQLHVLPLPGLVWSATGVIVLSILYYFLLPKPLPGIPYSQAAARSLFGDLPEMLVEGKKPRGLWAWLGDLTRRHNSTLFQLFPRPFSRPVVVVTDWRVGADLLQRNKVFDKGSMARDIFGVVIPNHQVQMTSTDPRLKGNKDLLRDSMVPSFLNTVSVPFIYELADTMVKMWKYKTRIAEGRAFEAGSDVVAVALDIICAVAFGTSLDQSTIHNWFREIHETKPVIQQDSEDMVRFPEQSLPEDLQTFVRVGVSMKVGLTSPIPHLHHRLLRIFTRLGKDVARKKEIINTAIQKTAKKFTESDGDEVAIKSGIDHMIARETRSARREGRVPVLDSPSMRDELYGYIIAGHDSTSTSLSWMLKYLTINQRSQEILRRHLQSVCVLAYKEKRQPTATEIVRAHLPYLDAFIEESLRFAPTIPLLFRQTTTDTDIQGVPIPKNTTVFIALRGPGMTEPTIAPSSSSPLGPATGRVGTWNEEDIADFKPERWLKHRGQTLDASRKVVITMAAEGDMSLQHLEYDSLAGPMLSFSVGARGCMGRRLAYLEMRIIIALLVWNFVFGDCPPEVSSYDVVDELTTKPKHCFVKLELVDIGAS